MLTLHNKDEIVMSAQADDVIDKEARDNLKDIDAGKKEFVHAGTTATGPITNAEDSAEVEIHKVTNTVAHEIKSDSESEYIEIKISLRKR